MEFRHNEEIEYTTVRGIRKKLHMKVGHPCSSEVPLKKPNQTDEDL